VPTGGLPPASPVRAGPVGVNQRRPLAREPGSAHEPPGAVEAVPHARPLDRVAQRPGRRARDVHAPQERWGAMLRHQRGAPGPGEVTEGDDAAPRVPRGSRPGPVLAAARQARDLRGPHALVNDGAHGELPEGSVHPLFPQRLAGPSPLRLPTPRAGRGAISMPTWPGKLDQLREPRIAGPGPRGREAGGGLVITGIVMQHRRVELPPPLGDTRGPLFCLIVVRARRPRRRCGRPAGLAPPCPGHTRVRARHAGGAAESGAAWRAPAAPPRQNFAPQGPRRRRCRQARRAALPPARPGAARRTPPARPYGPRPAPRMPAPAPRGRRSGRQEPRPVLPVQRHVEAVQHVTSQHRSDAQAAHGWARVKLVDRSVSVHSAKRHHATV